MTEGFAEPQVEAYGRGGGWQETVPVVTPAAGLGFAYTNEGQYVSRPVAVTFLLTTSAAAATRVPHLRYEDGNGGVFADVLGSTVPASFATRFSFLLGAGFTAVQNGVAAVAPLPDLFLQPGNILRLQVGAVDASDQVSAVFLTFDRFYTKAHHAKMHRLRELPERSDLDVGDPLDDEDLVSSTATSRPGYYR